MKVLEINKCKIKNALYHCEEITQKREKYLSCEQLNTIDNRGVLGKKEREYQAHNLALYLDKNYKKIFRVILNENFKREDKLRVRVEMMEFLLVGSLYMLIENGLAKEINARIKIDELHKLIYNKPFKEKFSSYNIKKLEKEYKQKIDKRKKDRKEKRDNSKIKKEVKKDEK